MEISAMKHNLSVYFNAYEREHANWTDDEFDELDADLDQQLRSWGIVTDCDVIDSIVFEFDEQGDYLFIRLEDGGHVKIWADGEYTAA